MTIFGIAVQQNDWVALSSDQIMKSNSEELLARKAVAERDPDIARGRVNVDVTDQGRRPKVERPEPSGARSVAAMRILPLAAVACLAALAAAGPAAARSKAPSSATYKVTFKAAVTSATMTPA